KKALSSPAPLAASNWWSSISSTDKFSIEMGDRCSDGAGKPASALLSDGRSGGRSASALATSGNRSGKPALKVSVIIGELPDSSRSKLRGDPWSSGGRSSVNFNTSLSTNRRLASGCEASIHKFQPELERTKRSSVAVTPA